MTRNFGSTAGKTLAAFLVYLDGLRPIGMQKCA